MTKVSSFAPVVGESPDVLVLGSMPGVRSLDAGQYYAHPRNSFWRIIGAITGFDPSADYQERLDALKRGGIALWDVLQSCVRPGSADSAIEEGTRVANDFQDFFREHSSIALVCFNGGEAERSFRRQVLGDLGDRPMRLVRLPSTSPAYAVLSFEQKLDAWRAVIGDRRPCARR